ncbi:MAG: hypothetical protein NPIRA05_00890 [Nitrospirales bacterium]|nr:MAG: hypothetical protein NPIRA05_00890 [Nitrospirales bacterium]
MKKLRNEVAYAVACCCEKCRTKSGRDFEILGCLHTSLKEAKEDLKAYRTHRNSQHFPVFLVRETVEPLITQKEAKRKAA